MLYYKHIPDLHDINMKKNILFHYQKPALYFDLFSFQFFHTIHNMLSMSLHPYYRSFASSPVINLL